MATNHKATPRRNENPERFIRRFIKKCKKMGFLDEYKERQEFTDQPTRKRRAKKKAELREKKRKRENGD